MRLFEPQATVPTLARLIGTLEENILTNYLTVEVSFFKGVYVFCMVLTFKNSLNFFSIKG